MTSKDDELEEIERKVVKVFKDEDLNLAEILGVLERVKLGFVSGAIEEKLSQRIFKEVDKDG